MAEGTSVSQDDVVCRYFLSATCRDGERCLFSHDSTRRIPDSVCRYYLQGVCVFGQNCRYDHVLLNEENPPKSNSNNERQSAGPSRRSANRSATCNFTRGETNKRNSHQPRFTNLSRHSPKNEGSNANRPGPASTNSSASASTNWINAPEFVPKHIRSYADTVKANTVINNEPERPPSEEICPFFAEGDCPFPDCRLIHGNVCELCQKAYLHPFNEEARKSHIEKCEKELEQEMEFSFAIQRSMDKTCGICMDIVLEKEPVSERRFGILEKCNHVYCLSCIRKWRRSRQYESNQHIDNALDPVVTRACPECRIASDFITPSVYFVDTEEEKQKLITEYKKALSKKACKYFKQGEGVCPFGGACFYLHAKPDGTKVDLPLPTRRRRQNQDGRNVSKPKQTNFPRTPLSVLYRFSSSDTAAYTASYDFETLTVTAPDDHILHVQLNRPECYNAMNKMFWREMLDCFRKIRDDRYCRAVIISGSGQLFSAGLDYSDMQDITSQVAGKGDVARKAKFLLSLIAKYQESFNAVENCSKPVIAAIHGKCSGGGVDLICACDVRYCSEDAFFEIEEVDVGMAADMGTLQRLPKIVGNDSLVREYAYSCAKIEPQEAKTIGLVGRVFPTKDEMMVAALKLAKVIASKSPVAIQGTKIALNFSRDHSVADGLNFMTYWNMTMLQSEDVLKAAEATINKSDKPPKYSKL